MTLPAPDGPAPDAPAPDVHVSVPITPAGLRDLVLDMARDGAALATRMRVEGVEVGTKSTATDLVTTADRAVEQLIRERIRSELPGAAVLGEEGGGPGDHTPAPGSVRFVVDPIDGTTNFVYGHPGWARSIAAEVDGLTVAGAVVVPTLGEEFAAARGEGSTRNGVALCLDDPPPVSSTLLATGFGYAPERRAHQARALLEILPRVRDVRRMGAASVDLCGVAARRVDAFFEWGMAPWDWAAGALVAQEAGARVADLDGGPMRNDGRTLAAHPDRWDELAGLLVAAGA